MKTDARSPETRGRGAGSVGPAATLALAVARNPLLAGGATAFFVTLAFVSANAVWYQPHVHQGAFFTTRPSSARIEIRRDAEEAPAPREIPRAKADPQPEAEPVAEVAAKPAGDPVVSTVQRVLRDLDLYSGEVDGLSGPQTRAAIERYQQIVGLTPDGKVSEELLEQLGRPLETGAIAPPAPRPAPRDETVQAIPASAPPVDATPQPAALPQERILRIQAGLKAFGNEAIEIDGKVGPRTRSAILEFQSLFGLPESGEPDAALYAKMREIGLAD